MVWFYCDDCGESIKKPKLANHFGCCSASSFTCIDCCQTFDRNSAKGHNTCVTEHEKYALGATKPGGFAEKGYPGSGGQAATPSKAAGGEPTGLQFLSERPPWKCSLCNVGCTSRETLLSHATGAKHQRKVRNATGPASTPAATSGAAGGEAAEKAGARANAAQEGGEGAPANVDQAAKAGGGGEGKQAEAGKKTKKRHRQEAGQGPHENGAAAQASSSKGQQQPQGGKRRAAQDDAAAASKEHANGTSKKARKAAANGAAGVPAALLQAVQQRLAKRGRVSAAKLRALLAEHAPTSASDEAAAAALTQQLGTQLGAKLSKGVLRAPAASNSA